MNISSDFCLLDKLLGASHSPRYSKPNTIKKCNQSFLKSSRHIFRIHLLVNKVQVEILSCSQTTTSSHNVIDQKPSQRIISEQLRHQCVMQNEQCSGEPLVNVSNDRRHSLQRINWVTSNEAPYFVCSKSKMSYLSKDQRKRTVQIFTNYLFL